MIYSLDHVRNDRLSVGVIAQLKDHYIAFTRLMDLNPEFQ